MFLLEVIDPIVKSLDWEFLKELGFGSILIRLILAILCGGIIGIDRARKHRAAGLRTYILVCLGAAIAMITNEYICRSTGTTDGARLGAQVISGIGFLGAGTILVTSRNKIKGLTTAAGLWSCACLGLAIGAGFYTLAILSTLLIIVVLTLLPIIEIGFTNKGTSCEIHIEFETRENLKQFVTFIRQMNIKISAIENNPSYRSSGLSVYSISLETKKGFINKDELLQKINDLDYVNYVEELY